MVRVHTAGAGYLQGCWVVGEHGREWACAGGAERVAVAEKASPPGGGTAEMSGARPRALRRGGSCTVRRWRGCASSRRHREGCASCCRDEGGGAGAATGAGTGRDCEIVVVVAGTSSCARAGNLEGTRVVVTNASCRARALCRERERARGRQIDSGGGGSDDGRAFGRGSLRREPARRTVPR